MSNTNGEKPPQIQDFIFYRELSEIYLLLDHISGRWDKSFYNGDYKGHARRTAPDWLQDVCEIGWPPVSGSKHDHAKQAEMLLYAKDKLNEAAMPATGASIAFTLMVIAGGLPEEEPWPPRWLFWPKALPAKAPAAERDSSVAADNANGEDDGQAGGLPAGGIGAPRELPDGGKGAPECRVDDLPGSPPPSRILLAHIAFPGLVKVAVSFKAGMIWILRGLAIWLIFTCLLSWNVAAGNVILGHLDAIHAQRKEIDKMIADLESKPGSKLGQDGQPTGGAGSNHSAASRQLVRFCKQSLLLKPTPTAQTDDSIGKETNKETNEKADQKLKKTLRVFHDPDELHLCDARMTNDVAHDASSRDLTSWLGLWRTGYQIVNVKEWPVWTFLGLGGPAPKTCKKPPQDEDSDQKEELAETRKEVRTEETARIVALVLGGSVLPLCYGILGAGAAIVRDLWAKMRESMLCPRDYTLALGQLALGATIGACIGLFVSPSGGGTTHTDGALVASWGLSASALSFVAGFGVESVFLALESLVRRIFNTPDPAERAP